MAKQYKYEHWIDYQRNLREGYDVVIPPIPIEEYDPIAYSVRTKTIDNWANFFLKFEKNVDWLTKRAKRSVYVFVLDTAGRYSHPNILGVDNSLGRVFTGEQSPDDGHGHSTHVAGIISADHPQYKLGVARELARLGLLKVVPIKVLTNQGGGRYDWIAAGIEYVMNLDVDGVKVLSMSLGSSLRNPRIEALLAECIKRQMFVVAAAGNDGYVEDKDTVNFPGIDPNTLCIGALSMNGTRAEFSSVGESLDFVLPGVDIWSTYLNGGYASMSGTSMATPAMSGVVAWLLSIYELLKYQSQLKEFLINYITDFGIPGHDKFYGYGCPIIEKYILEDDSGGEDPSEPPEDAAPDINWISLVFILILLVVLIYFLVK